MIRTFVIASAALIAAPALAQAQAPAKAAPQEETRASFVANIDSGFVTLDTNKDGFLNKAEIEARQAQVLAQAKTAQQQRMEEEFKALDTDKNGSLSVAEFKAAVRPLPAPQGDAAIAQLDTNKDGKVSRDEFRNPRVAAFDKVDANHDGKVTAAEVQAASSR